MSRTRIGSKFRLPNGGGTVKSYGYQLPPGGNRDASQFAGVCRRAAGAVPARAAGGKAPTADRGGGGHRAASQGGHPPAATPAVPGPESPPLGPPTPIRPRRGRRPHRDVQGVVRLRGPGARSATRRPHQRHRRPHGPVDRQPTRGGVPLGDGPAIPPARPRCGLRGRLLESSPGHGDPRSQSASRRRTNRTVFSRRRAAGRHPCRSPRAPAGGRSAAPSAPRGSCGQ
jgi:hypothetical protein